MSDTLNKDQPSTLPFKRLITRDPQNFPPRSPSLLNPTPNPMIVSPTKQASNMQSSSNRNGSLMNVTFEQSYMQKRESINKDESIFQKVKKKLLEIE